MDELAGRYPPLNGGALCLDFANTYEPDTPTGQERDHLGEDYDSLLSWTRYAGVLDTATQERLRVRAHDEPLAATEVVRKAHELRRAIAVAFSTVAGQRPPPDQTLQQLRSAYADAVGASALIAGDDGICWSWIAADEPSVPLNAITASAIDLLTSHRLGRVKQCAADRCWVLFLDTTKNGSRRWCLMRYCGNAAKSHHQAARRRAARQRVSEHS